MHPLFCGHFPFLCNYTRKHCYRRLPGPPVQHRTGGVRARTGLSIGAWEASWRGHYKKIHYYQGFLRFCRQHSEIVRYDNAMRTQAELAEVYRQARGFVLLSRWETQSLSALEAAASECPLLISDLPWAHSTFGAHVTYCPLGSKQITAEHLRRFHDQAPMMELPPKPLTWTEVGKMLKKIYEHVLTTDEV